jgi:ATP-binding cassette subfamily B protein/ATP-binding cassette subfamily C protein
LIVVAHRLSTVVDSDRIVVLDDGRVVGAGPHHELLGTSPLYRELATHQLLVS